MEENSETKIRERSVGKDREFLFLTKQSDEPTENRMYIIN